MGKYTVEQIKKSFGDSWDDEQDEGNTTEVDWDSVGDGGTGTKFTAKIAGDDVEFEIVDGKLPCEGGGEDIWFVFKTSTLFGTEDQLFRKCGSYVSHHGSDWDGDLTEVRPVEKTVTVYEDVS